MGLFLVSSFFSRFSLIPNCCLVGLQKKLKAAISTEGKGGNSISLILSWRFLRLHRLCRYEKQGEHFWQEWDGEMKTKYIIPWKKRNVKNSLVYYVKKKMAHLLLHKCYIHIVFSVTVTEKNFELLAAGWKGLSIIPWIWHRIQICNKPTMETGEQDEKRFISDK